MSAAVVVVACAWLLSACATAPATVNSTAVATPTSSGTVDQTSPDEPSSSGTLSNADMLQQSAKVIQQRLDAAGYVGSSVTVQGSNQLVISVQTVDSQSVVDLVDKRGVLDFRAVYEVMASTSAVVPVAPAGTPTRRVAPGLPTAPPTERPTAPGSNPNTSFTDLLNWQPTSQDTRDFENWSCAMVIGGDGTFPAGTSVAGQASQLAVGTPVYPDGTPIVDVWDQPMFACDASYQKYLLGPVLIPGTSVASAQSGIPQGGIYYQVTMNFDSQGTDQFTQVTTKLVNQTSPMNQFAIVLDGSVVSAPVVQSAITGGQAQITGQFTQQQASDLARVLNYGSLPLSFDPSSVTVKPPSSSFGTSTTVVVLTVRTN